MGRSGILRAGKGTSPQKDRVWERRNFDKGRCLYAIIAIWLVIDSQVGRTVSPTYERDGSG